MSINQLDFLSFQEPLNNLECCSNIVEKYKNYIHNKNYYVDEVGVKVARELVKKYHYSKKVVPNSKLHLGIFSNETDELIGVLQYGTPMNAKSTPGSLVVGSTQDDMYELNRMAMLDSAPKLCESQAIGLTFKWIKRFKPQIKWLLSFSDGKQGNVGVIYQATNWDYYGYRLSDSFYRLDGEIWHSVQIWHKYRQGKPDVTIMDELYKNYANVSKIQARQHIYIFPLVKGLQFTREKKPYPKKETEPLIVKEIVYKQNGVVLGKPHTLMCA